MSDEAKVFDFRGLQCPLPVFETSKAIKQIGVGEEIVVMANDPAARPDLEAWSKRTGHPILNVEDKGDHIKLTIRRSH
ncbi:MAG: sulfurtransferase TusA family protein [Thermoplasmata archaeon]|uniref:Sulfurtransferase TusA family protein n=1 Tax=Candidatus Sysuiplasma superficiale TaxID=2823368 RepID=A0A8J7YRD0_9ARCH|nr:sulfurtransferase TusA family protein [Candidatus Sysuiplasma superficiale]MBX8643162.1 sulfurtransferase TusA family protein [Candidatus Sysuiplasma superficiale]MCL4346519.1 sulfurtransferase TusA family protein [Candidatus Thermoplasmatota archaeon]